MSMHVRPEKKRVDTGATSRLPLCNKIIRELASTAADSSTLWNAEISLSHSLSLSLERARVCSFPRERQNVTWTLPRAMGNCHYPYRYRLTEKNNRKRGTFVDRFEGGDLLANECIMEGISSFPRSLSRLEEEIETRRHAVVFHFSMRLRSGCPPGF